jgi:hypothetical protein
VNDENKNLKEEVKNAMKEAAMRRDSHTAKQAAPSLHHRHQPDRGVRQVLPSEGGRRKLYADAVKNQEEKLFRITLKAKDETTTPEQIKQQLKINIIRVGTEAVKTFREKGILVETGSEEEKNTLSSEIINKLG